MNLPQEFIQYTANLFGSQRWERFEQSFVQEAAVSVRFNPWKAKGEALFPQAEPVPWCEGAFWLKERPLFTRDPRFHAGVYYVQEAGSLFLDHALRHWVTGSVSALDLCAAPGGKSTLMRAALPAGSVLVSNEIDRRRANILLENILKQGHPGVLVTHNAPKDFAKTNLLFDVILTDVPCSGEGLFRRDPAAISEWSAQNVYFCVERQRQILRDIWYCLKDGGLLIYSTCTFNTHENEENVRWIAEELGAFYVLRLKFEADRLALLLNVDGKITQSLQLQMQAKMLRMLIIATRRPRWLFPMVRIDQHKALLEKGKGQGQKLRALRRESDLHQLIHLDGLNQRMGLSRTLFVDTGLLSELHQRKFGGLRHGFGFFLNEQLLQIEAKLLPGLLELSAKLWGGLGAYHR